MSSADSYSETEFYAKVAVLRSGSSECYCTMISLESVADCLGGESFGYWFTARELAELSLHGSPSPERLVGRLAAKRALLGRTGGDLKKVEILTSKGGRPYALRHTTGGSLWGVSLAHCRQYAVGAAFPEGRVGVDLEEVRPRHPAFQARVLQDCAPAVREDLCDLASEEAMLVTLLWTVKEATVKLTGAGFVGLGRTYVARWVPDPSEAPTVPLEPFGPKARQAVGRLWVHGCGAVRTLLVASPAHCMCVAWKSTHRNGGAE